MAKARKDHRGRALRKGEIQRKDKTYMYTYTDPYGKRRYIYANDLVELREKEKRLMKDVVLQIKGASDLQIIFYEKESRINFPSHYWNTVMHII